jgi:hypothetical protein
MPTGRGTLRTLLAGRHQNGAGDDSGLSLIQRGDGFIPIAFADSAGGVARRVGTVAPPPRRGLSCPRLESARALRTAREGWIPVVAEGDYRASVRHRLQLDLSAAQERAGSLRQEHVGYFILGHGVNTPQLGIAQAFGGVQHVSAGASSQLELRLPGTLRDGSAAPGVAGPPPS